MAFSTNGSSGLRRGRFTGPSNSMAEINIVPLVDVVLVLLIIFMLTAHVMDVEMPSHLQVSSLMERKEEVVSAHEHYMQAQLARNGIARRFFPIARATCDFFRIAGERLLVYHERASEKDKKRRKGQRTPVAGK